MQTQPPVVLEAVGLHKTYGTHEALHDVSIEARAGERVACIGPNGAGKTTLLTILAGIQTADAGTVTSAPGRAGWVPQALALYPKLTVAENLRLFARLEVPPTSRRRSAGSSSSPACAIARTSAWSGSREATGSG